MMNTRIFSLFILLIAFFAATAVVHGTAALQSGIINGDNVNLRADPGPYGHIVSMLPKGILVSILQQSGRWYEVQLQDGRTGWIYRQYIEVKPLAPVTSRNRFITSGASELIAYAKSFLEISYVYGGDSPRGFDCSGFTMYIFARFGISLPHQAELQKDIGMEVPVMGELRPGDLVFFKTEGSASVNHVGIYLGDSQFIHASSGYGAVRISPLDDGYYYKCYAGGRRLANNNSGDGLNE
jgi:uncharacterized protein YraI